MNHSSQGDFYRTAWDAELRGPVAALEIHMVRQKHQKLETARHGCLSLSVRPLVESKFRVCSEALSLQLSTPSIRVVSLVWRQ
jgi:hypothetical protein